MIAVAYWDLLERRRIRWNSRLRGVIARIAQFIGNFHRMIWQFALDEFHALHKSVGRTALFNIHPTHKTIVAIIIQVYDTFVRTKTNAINTWLDWLSVGMSYVRRKTFSLSDSVVCAVSYFNPLRSDRFLHVISIARNSTNHQPNILQRSFHRTERPFSDICHWHTHSRTRSGCEHKCDSTRAPQR